MKASAGGVGGAEIENIKQLHRKRQGTEHGENERYDFCSFWFQALPEASVHSSFCVHEPALVLNAIVSFPCSASLSLSAFLTTQDYE